MFLREYADQQSSEVYHAKSWGLRWGADLIEEMKVLATANTRQRVRLCMNPTPDEVHQEMLIVMTRECVEAPQRRRHGFDTKVLIDGSAVLSYFYDDGREVERFRLARDASLYLHTRPGLFHALTVESDFFVFLELAPGPFARDTNEFAAEFDRVEPSVR